MAWEQTEGILRSSQPQTVPTGGTRLWVEGISGMTERNKKRTSDSLWAGGNLLTNTQSIQWKQGYTTYLPTFSLRISDDDFRSNDFLFYGNAVYVPRRKAVKNPVSFPQRGFGKKLIFFIPTLSTSPHNKFKIFWQTKGSIHKKSSRGATTTPRWKRHGK